MGVKKAIVTESISVEEANYKADYKRALRMIVKGLVWHSPEELTRHGYLIVHQEDRKEGRGES